MKILCSLIDIDARIKIIYIDFSHIYKNFLLVRLDIDIT